MGVNRIDVKEVASWFDIKTHSFEPLVSAAIMVLGGFLAPIYNGELIAFFGIVPDLHLMILQHSKQLN